ncbi:FYSH domain-containing protein [Calocera viscosa TUFC12733]|uniref:FYSH domain-containing protein n=1 Tax=Calocera viscosa (strain TUFC12733) TaxID=1330018 RepID=A0A167NVC9_CALVF|nr:FYSH domain-containing protein [Calocera viscosa TUFC12733]
MVKSVSQLVYKPDSMSTDEMIMIIQDASAYKKWKDGDHTIPLVDILDGFGVYHSGQGSQGNLGKASKQTLETVFDTANEDEIALIMLEKGVLKSSEALNNPKWSDTNKSKGVNLDTRGSGRGTHGI